MVWSRENKNNNTFTGVGKSGTSWSNDSQTLALDVSYQLSIGDGFSLLIDDTYQLNITDSEKVQWNESARN